MPLDWFPLWLSLKVAVAATVLSLPPGLWLGWRLQNRQSPGHGMLWPLALPPTVLLYYLLALLGAEGGLSFTWPGAVAAAMFEAVPLLAISAQAAFERVDRACLRAARSLGASEWRVFRRVGLPLARGSLLAATVLCFARALGDCGLTLIVAGLMPGRVSMLDAAVRRAVESPGGALARGLALLVSVAAIAVLALAGRLLSRRVAG